MRSFVPLRYLQCRLSAGIASTGFKRCQNATKGFHAQDRGGPGKRVPVKKACVCGSGSKVASSSTRIR